MSAAMEPADNPLLAAALGYARRGWQVIPLHDMYAGGHCTCDAGAGCKTPGKHPRVADWVKRGTTSGADLYEWWSTWPRANVGILTGRASGVWALDADLYHDAGATLAGYEHDYGALPATRIHSTGSGGLHYLWSLAPDGQPGHIVPSTTGRHGNALGPGLDTRGEGGMIVAPPSRSGKGDYRVAVGGDPAAPPGWLADRMHEILTTRARPAAELGTVAPEPVADADLPRKLRMLLGELKPDGERHQHFWAIVAEARRAGLTPGQAAAALAPWCDAVDKFRGRVPQEVARAWVRLEAEQAATVVEVPQVPPAPPGPPQADYDSGNYALVLPLFPPAGAPAAPSWAPAPTWTTQAYPPPSPPDWAPPAPARMNDRVQRMDWDQDDDEEEAADWLWEPFVERGALAVVYSPPGAGKSLWCQDGAAALAVGGGAPGDVPREPLTVAYVDAENAARTVRARFKDMGYKLADLANLWYYAFPDLLPLDTELGGREFVQLITETGAAIVFLDTTGQFLDGEENASETFRHLYRFTLQPLKALGIAVVLLDHSGKDLDKKQRGSSAKAGDPDVTWRLTPHGDTRLRLTREKDRLGRGPCTLEIRRLPEPLQHHVTVIPTSLDLPGGGSIGLGGQAEDWIVEGARRLREYGAPFGITKRGALDLLREREGRAVGNSRIGPILAHFRQLALPVDSPVDNPVDEGDDDAIE